MNFAMMLTANSAIISLKFKIIEVKLTAVPTEKKKREVKVSRKGCIEFSNDFEFGNDEIRLPARKAPTEGERLRSAAAYAMIPQRLNEVNVVVSSELYFAIQLNARLASLWMIR